MSVSYTHLDVYKRQFLGKGVFGEAPGTEDTWRMLSHQTVLSLWRRNRKSLTVRSGKDNTSNGGITENYGHENYYRRSRQRCDRYEVRNNHNINNNTNINNYRTNYTIITIMTREIEIIITMKIVTVIIRINIIIIIDPTRPSIIIIIIDHINLE